MPDITHSGQAEKTWIITGPTSGIGHRTALDLAAHGTVVLVGRDAARLTVVRNEIESGGGKAVTVTGDLADIRSVRHAAAEIVALELPIAGVVNNAGIMPMQGGKSAQGWDLAFATNHLGPFAFTEALMPHLPDGTNIVFVCSGVEDPERKPARKAGFRGGRYISAAASADGDWAAGGSSRPGFDAYATSKQCELATVFTFARETQRLRFNAVEPGFNPGTGLGRDAHPALQFVARHVLAPLAPLVRYWSTPKRAAQIITKVATDPASASGTYFDEDGRSMQPSARVRDPEFDDRVVAETRALLATVPEAG